MRAWGTTLHQAISENETGQASSTRIAVLIGSVTLSFSTLLLSIAVLWQIELVPALSVVAGALGAMAGVSYTAGRAWSGRKSWTDQGMSNDLP